MKLVVQESPDGRVSLLLASESSAEMFQLVYVKQKALALKLDHWDSDSNNLGNWTKPDDWGFNLVLVREKGI